MTNVLFSDKEIKLPFEKKRCSALRGDYFTMYLRPKTMSEKPQTITVWTYLKELTTAERWLLTEVLNTHNYKNNTAHVIPSSEVEKNYVKHGYKKLFEDGWISRIKRGFYMLNPVIKEVSPVLMLDAITTWNTYCHSDTVIDFEVHESSKAYDLDTEAIFRVVNDLILTSKTDVELKELLNIMRSLHWIDASNHLTNRVPTNYTQLPALLNECKVRGLV